MCYKVVLKRTVYVDADSPEEAEELALEGGDLFGVEEEILLVKLRAIQAIILVLNPKKRKEVTI